MNPGEPLVSHALIIDDNMIVSRAIQNCLQARGFTSFDHTWTENQAVAAAARCPPDLIVIGDEVETGSSLGAARQIAGMFNVPGLMVTGDTFRAQRHLEGTSAFKGPFLLNQLDEAVHLARSETQSPEAAYAAASAEHDVSETWNIAP